MRERRSECPIAFALDVVGDRWSLLIVRDIALYGRRHNRQFQGAGEGIATNILASRLRLLVDQGILHRARDPDSGRRRIYTLTDKGLDLLPLLVEMIVWSARHDPETPVPESYLTRATQDRAGLVQELRERALAARAGTTTEG